MRSFRSNNGSYAFLRFAAAKQHDHPAFVLYAVTPFKRKLVLPDGRTLIREFKAGDVIHSEAQTHIGENVGTTPTHVIMLGTRHAGSGKH